MSDSLSRKEFIRQGFGQVGRSLFNFLAPVLAPGFPDQEPESPPQRPPTPLGVLRPPGALPEADFLAKCTGCNLCVESCPHEIIKLGEAEDGQSLGLPFLPSLAAKPCQLCDGLPCAAACPEGALLVVPAEAVRLGIAVIDPQTCSAFKGQYCDYCIDRCPFAEEAIAADEQNRPVVNTERCTGCGLCAHFCVSSPGSIAIRPVQDELSP